MALSTDVGALSIRVGADLSGLTQSLEIARRSVSATSGTLSGELSLLSRSAGVVFDNMGDAIERVASGGKTSMRGLVDSILRDLSRLAIRTFITGPLEQIFNGLFTGLSSPVGARAMGGAVSPGQPFLVGERGPELFVPAAAGRIAPHAGANVVVNIQARDAESVLRSETQIAAMMSRALARGSRNL